jgi:small subunit ribosomal protein S20
MPSEKSARRAVKRGDRNKMTESEAKTYVRIAEESLSDGLKEDTEGAVRQATSFLDRAVKRGAINRNVASRKKSRLHKLLNSSMSSGIEEKPNLEHKTKKAKTAK